ncbi:MAG: formyltetrahydrofolate deformylase [Deltaproteobacteria bacterium]|nr:formyltetrahydrofolate deformylase [Deltaproteobacteria bacterium]
MDDPHAILLITCPDGPGLVANVAGFVYDHHGNIVHSDQHSDLDSRRFYMRIEWQLDGFALDRSEIAGAFGEVAQPFDMAWSLHFTDERSRMGVLVSRADHCLWDVLLRHRAGEFHAEVPVVVSNHPDLEPVAAHFGVDFHHVPNSKDTRAASEAAMVRILEEHRVDLVVLARYMQILTGDFVSRYRNRVINVHHSFLPAFVGARPYHQAHQRGVKIIGATSHYVIADLDQGPIIEQVIRRTSHRDSVRDLVRKGRDLEKAALARAVSLHLQHRILVVGNKTVVFD